MKDWIELVTDKLGSIGDTSTLRQVLLAIEADTSKVTKTNTYIRRRQSQRPDKAEANEPYQDVLLGMLKQMKVTQVKLTGLMKPSDCMCLFVCGLLEVRGVSFSEIVEKYSTYADEFFDYMIEMNGKTMEVVVENMTDNDPVSLDGEVSGACFICAETNSKKNMLHDDILVLDAFSYENQFVEYHPAVWHLYCLWWFGRDISGSYPVSCYSVKGPTSYIFIGNYEEHVRSVVVNANKTVAISALLSKPITMYRECVRKLNLTPQAVLSRICPPKMKTNLYMPLLYVHLFVQQNYPIYIDTTFNDTVQEILAFVVGAKQQEAIDSLTYTQNIDSAVTLPQYTPTLAYTLLANEHHKLMKTHKFVIPEKATEEQILFHDFDASHTSSQHLDYIDAICEVRYNWVFDLKSGHANLSMITRPAPGANYHDIDVYRHITHLGATAATPKDFWQKLLTGAYVTETVGAQRSGIIIFDVEEHGRYYNYFEHHETLPLENCLGTCSIFGVDQTSANNEQRVYDAMTDYFYPPNEWSLCDMAFKYVVYVPEDRTFFMRDSFQLKPDKTKQVTQATWELFPFCPVCFLKHDDLPDGNSMYDHIGTHTGYPLAYWDGGTPAASIAPSDPTQSEPSFGASDNSSIDSASGAGRKSNDSDSDISDRSDPLHTTSFSVRAVPGGAGYETNKHVEEMRTLILELQKHSKVEAGVGVEATANLAAFNYDKLKTKCDELQRLVQQDESKNKELQEQLEKANKNLEERNSKLTHATETESSLAKQISELEQKNNDKIQELIEKQSNVEAQTKDNKELQNEIQQLRDNLTDHERIKKLVQELDSQLQDSNAQNQRLNEEINRLNQRIADLQADVARLTDELGKRPDENALVAPTQQIADLQADVARLTDELGKRPDENALVAPNQRIAELEADVARLTDELAKRPPENALVAPTQQIADLQTEVARLKEELGKRPTNDDHNSLKQQIDALNKRIEDLQKQVDILKREKAELQKRLTNTQDLILTNRQNEEHWQERYEYLVDAHAALEDELRKLQEALKQAVGDNRKNFRGLRDKIAQSAQEQIALANLADLADKGEFPAIREAVWSHAKGEKKRYSPAAVFLILESMGGTWKLWLDNETRKNIASQEIEYKQRKTLLLRQVVYHLTMWRSIANAPKRTRYMSKYVALFIDKHELVNQDDPDPAAPPSSDDDDDGDGPAATPSFANFFNAALSRPPGTSGP